MFYKFDLTIDKCFRMAAFCVAGAQCPLPWELLKDQLKQYLVDRAESQGLLLMTKLPDLVVLAKVHLEDCSAFDIHASAVKGLTFHLSLTLDDLELGLRLTCTQPLLLHPLEDQSIHLEPITLRLGNTTRHKTELLGKLLGAYNRSGRLRPLHLYPDEFSIVAFDYSETAARIFNYALEGDKPRRYMFKVQTTMEMLASSITSMLISAPAPSTGNDCGNQSLLQSLARLSNTTSTPLPAGRGQAVFSPFATPQSHRSLAGEDLGLDQSEVRPQRTRLFATMTDGSDGLPASDTVGIKPEAVQALKDRVCSLEKHNQELLAKNLETVINNQSKPSARNVEPELFKAIYLSSFVEFSKLSILAPQLTDRDYSGLASQLGKFKALQMPLSLTRVAFTELNLWLMAAGAVHLKVLKEVCTKAQGQHLGFIQTLLRKVAALPPQSFAAINVRLTNAGKKDHVLRGLGARFQLARMTFVELGFSRRHICGLCLLVVPTSRLTDHLDSHARDLSCSTTHVTLFNNIVMMGVFLALGSAEVVNSVDKMSLDEMLAYSPQAEQADPTPLEIEALVKVTLMHMSCLPRALFDDLLGFTMRSFKQSSIAIPDNLSEICLKRYDTFAPHLGTASLGRCLLMAWDATDMHLQEIFEVRGCLLIEDIFTCEGMGY